MGFPTLLESELLAVSKALGDTEFGFTGTEIGLLLSECGLKDIDSKIQNIRDYLMHFVSKVEKIIVQTAYINLYKYVWSQLED